MSALLGCLVVILIGVFVMVCAGILNFNRSRPSSSSHSFSTQRPTTPPTPQPVRDNDQAGTIPDDVSFTIIDVQTVPGIKRSLDIRLGKKVSEETLRAIALRLKADDPRTYERTFIAYYLPDMTVGAGAWATTHFNPKLEVRILGLTAETEKMLAEEPAPASREIVGRWLDERPSVGSRITIFRENGKLYFERKFKDGSSLKEEFIEKQSSTGQRFDKVTVSITGDHWVIDRRGDLQIRDNDGLITTAQRIDR